MSLENLYMIHCDLFKLLGIKTSIEIEFVGIFDKPRNCVIYTEILTQKAQFTGAGLNVFSNQRI